MPGGAALAKRACWVAVLLVLPAVASTPKSSVRPSSLTSTPAAANLRWSLRPTAREEATTIDLAPESFSRSLAMASAKATPMT